MDREKFIKRFNEEPNNNVNSTWLLNVLNRSIDANVDKDKFRGFSNLVITNEELAELVQEVSKYLREKGDYYNVLQELADVMICTNYVKMICGINDENLNKAINVKLKRIEDELNKNGQYK